MAKSGPVKIKNYGVEFKHGAEPNLENVRDGL